MNLREEIIEQGLWLLTPQSSNIVRLRYLKEKKVLIIQFSQGVHYKYTEIPADLALALAESSSKGKFFHAYIRNRFKGVKCDEEGNFLTRLSEKK